MVTPRAVESWMLGRPRLWWSAWRQQWACCSRGRRCGFGATFMDAWNAWRGPP